MLRFILLAVTLSVVRAVSDTEVELRRRLEVLEATVQKLLERDAEREAALSSFTVQNTPRRLARRLAEVKTDGRKGIKIKNDKAWFTMGKKDDFKLMYTGASTATVVGNLEVTGKLKSNSLKALADKTSACATVAQMKAAIRAAQTCSIRKLSDNHPSEDKALTCKNGLKSIHECLAYCRKQELCKGFWYYNNGRCCPKSHFNKKFTKKVPGGGFYDFDCGPSTAIPFAIKVANKGKPEAPKGSYIAEFHGKVWFLYLQNGKGANLKKVLRSGANANGYGSASITKTTGGFKIAEAEFDRREITTVMAVTDDNEYVIISYKDGSPIKASDAFAVRGPSKQVIIKDWTGRSDAKPKYFGPATSDKHGPFFHDNWGYGYGWMWTDHSGSGDTRMGSIGLTKAASSVNHGWRWFAQIPGIVAPTPPVPQAPKGSYTYKFNGKVWWLYLQNGKGKNYKNVLRFGKNVNGYGSTTASKRSGVAFKISETVFNNHKVKTVMAMTDDGEYVIISYKNGSPIVARDAYAAGGPTKQVILKDWKGRGKAAVKYFGPATSDKHGPLFHDNWGKGYGWMWTDHSGSGDMRMGSIGLTKASQSVNHGWRWFAQFED